MERLTDFELQQIDNQLINDKTNTQIRKLVDEVKEYRQLEKQSGCPLEVRCNLDINDIIFDRFGNKYIARSIGKKDFVAYDVKKMDNNEFYRQLFLWKEYKVTWWLKEDRSE